MITGQERSISISSQEREWIAGMDSLDDVFGKATRQADAPSLEALAKQGLATTAVEAFVTLG